MTNDLVRRLRDDAEFAANMSGTAVEKWIMSDAADRIEALEAAIDAAPVSVQEAAQVLVDAFSDGAPHIPQYRFWKAYWEHCGDDEQNVYGGVTAGLRALAEGQNDGK